MADDKDHIDPRRIEPDELARYRGGLMNEAERHALEKKALGDPFLADALEGAEKISAEAFSKDVHELSVKLTGARGNWFTPLRIAAGVMVLLASGSLLYYFTTSEPPQLAMKGPAAADSSAITQKDSSSALLSLAKPEEPASNESTPVQQPRKSIKVDPKIAGTAASGAGEQQKPGESIVAKADDALNKIEITVPEVEEAREEAKKQAISESEKDLAAPAAAGQKASRAKVASSLSSKRIVGHVVSSDDGTPLPGVNVIVKGTNQGAITDGEGNFQISTQANSPQLVMSFIGMETKEVSVDKVPIEVKLNPDVRSLSEVIVAGYRDDSVEEEDTFEFTAPVGGRSAFQKYLEASIRYPAQAIANKTEGKVTVQFTVTASGSLTNFTFIKSIGNGCEEELVRLIQDGPAWTPSLRNHVPTEDKVRVRLRFTLPR